MWSGKELSLSKTKNFGLFQTESLHMIILNLMKMENSLKWYITLWKKEKSLVMSNFSFFHTVLIFVLQMRKNKGFFGKRLSVKILNYKQQRQRENKNNKDYYGLQSKRTQTKTYPSQNVPKWSQNVPKWSQNVPKWSQNVPIVKSKRTHVFFFLTSL